MRFNFKQFTEERDAALRSLDEAKIRAYADKYGVPMPPNSDAVFWAAVHKARLCLKAFSADEKAVSQQWLRDNGFALPTEVDQ